MKIICIMRTKPGCRSALSLQCELSQQTKVGCETRAGPDYGGDGDGDGGAGREYDDDYDDDDGDDDD